MIRARTSRASRLARFVATLAGALLLTGCDFDVYKLPLPGGTDVGDDPIEVKVVFADVLDLVPRSSVKVNDVSVGQVTDVELQGYSAEVTLALRNDTELPDNTYAEIRQTSLLGEKFVSLEPPSSGATGKLESGEVIPLERTGRNPEVEEVLGALSLVLNGGGVAQMQTIARELNLALEGREDSARSVLTQIDALMGQLDDHKADIVRAIESLNRLAVTANEQMDSIDLALEELPSAVSSLDRQRDDLVRMLEALNELGDVGVRVIRATKADTIAVVRQLQPVLTELANSGDHFVNAFHVFLTYPFVDETVGRNPQEARDLRMGDFTNLSIRLDLDFSGGFDGGTQLPTLLPSGLNPQDVVNGLLACIQSGSPTSRECRRLPDNVQTLLQLQEECLKPENRNTAVCRSISQIPGLGGLLPAPGGGSGGSGGSGGGGIPGLEDLGGILGRPGFDADRQTYRGASMDDLHLLFDPGLVDLLAPAMADAAAPRAARRGGERG